MSKVTLDFIFQDEDGKVISTVTFQSIEDIDLCIEKLQEARAEFEHRIEMKKQKAREKRKRRKEKFRNESENSIGEMEKSYENLMDSYNQMPGYLKELFKPIADAVTRLVESVRKENVK